MRKLLLLSIVLVTGVVFASRLFYLQVYNTSYEKLSENNAVKVVYDYPQRGYIFDRNGELLVSNQPSYDVMVIPKDVKPLDTLEFCKLLNISKEDFVAPEDLSIPIDCEALIPAEENSSEAKDLEGLGL